jgi:hypothetical protein
MIELDPWGPHASEHRVLEQTIASLSQLGERVILWCKVATAVIGFCTAVVVVYGTVTAAYARPTLESIVANEMRKRDAATAAKYDALIEAAADRGARKAVSIVRMPQDRITP